MQRRSMFSAGKAKPESNIMAATTSFIIDKQAKKLKELPLEERMLCALRKVLTDMSDADEDGRRFFISSNKLEIKTRPTGNPGGGGTYFGAGRFVLGAILKTGEMTSRPVGFGVTFRDTLDSRGLPDVVYLEPTHLDDLSGTPIQMVDLS